jgi:cyanophycin synthetase
VVVQGTTVLEGDFTGPAGAARIFDEPEIDEAVLETARGGILFRGLGYESNDVSVVTNVSADHLGVQGVYTVEELARVKQVVAAVTKPEGFVVLNASDPLVMGMVHAIRGRPFLISRDGDQPEFIDHRAAGGWALWVDRGLIRFAHDGVEEGVSDLNDVPITFGGKALHMVENALCAAAAALASGVDIDNVRNGLAKFRNQADQNRGRLNVFEINGATVVVDFAHNAAGLTHLLMLGRGFTFEGGRLIAAIGTAGDRSDDAIIELGALAGEQADVVIAKDTVKYLRGRASGEIPALIRSGTQRANQANVKTAPNEHAAFELGLGLLKPGDTLVIMSIENLDQILNTLSEQGTAIS